MTATWAVMGEILVNRVIIKKYDLLIGVQKHIIMTLLFVLQQRS